VTTILVESFVVVTVAVRLPFVRWPFIIPLASIWTVALSEVNPSSDLSGMGSPTGTTGVGVGANALAAAARAAATVGLGEVAPRKYPRPSMETSRRVTTPTLRA